ncbi:MAG: hypothetical protein J0L64_07460 [Acidobacteria bacterium]|nr:hypothetical protein [Acidobacteriota bacterium]
MSVGIQHLHTYFLFPFSIDKQAVSQDHPEVFGKYHYWIDALDEWLMVHQSAGCSGITDKLGTWRRTAYTRFDMDAQAYQDMVFFHPYVRRVFFDARDENPDNDDTESLLRCYTMRPPAGSRLYFEAGDGKGRSAKCEATDLRLFLMANGIGILSIGVEGFDLTAKEALWINEAMRKVYPSSGRQVRESRVPNRAAFTLETNGVSVTLAEETFQTGEMHGFLPPLSRLITSLLYFADYEEQELEPVLDERMIVYTYCAIDPKSVPEDFIETRDYQVFLSRLLYVDRYGEDYRYDEAFTRQQMTRQLYRRWSHQGTYYGFTSYSNVTCTVGAFDCDEHELREGFLVHRMFNTRYYLMAMVALFYRATLLDFAERTALVSRQLFKDMEDGRLATENVRLTADLRAEFLHFSNYWYFEELANKDEEIEHFTLHSREYRVEQMKKEIEEEIDKLNESLHNHYQFRNTEAVNRLAMLSLILGAGAVATGFFGMNFQGQFEQWFFLPAAGGGLLHNGAIAAVALLGLGAIGFGAFMIVSNWGDYRESLLPRWWLQRGLATQRSLRRGGPGVLPPPKG